MNRRSTFIGIQAVIVAMICLVLLSSTGALSRYWLISDAENAIAERLGAGRATAGLARPDRENEEADGADGWRLADSASGPFESDPAVLDDLVCGGETDQTETMLRDWRPDHGEDSEDWLLALATLMGLAEAWNDGPSNPWPSCQM